MTTRPGYIWSGTEWVSIGQEAVVAPVSYQASAPSSPATGDIWIDSNDDVPGIDTSQFLRWRKTAAGGETSVSGTDDNGLTLQYTANYEQVYLNGVLLVRGQDYTATNGTSITGLTALAANDVVEVFGVVARVVGDTYTQAQVDAKDAVLPKGIMGLASATSTFTTTSGTPVDVTGMSVTFNGVTGRRYRASFNGSQIWGTNGDRARLTITGTNISQQMNNYLLVVGSFGGLINSSVVFTASTTGTTTVKIQLCRDSGSGSLNIYADANAPMQLVVEDIGPA